MARSTKYITCVGARIKELRERRAFSIVKAARKAGIAPSTWLRVEHGLIMPTLDTVYRMANVLHTNRFALMLRAGYFPVEAADNEALRHAVLELLKNAQATPTKKARSHAR